MTPAEYDHRATMPLPRDGEECSTRPPVLRTGDCYSGACHTSTVARPCGQGDAPCRWPTIRVHPRASPESPSSDPAVRTSIGPEGNLYPI